jgi:polar amino acid transport system ATP-binding protein
MGPSGSGKSTFLRSLIWLVKPRRGRVVIDGIEARQDTVREVRKKVGFVFQSYNLFPHLKVIDNIVLPLLPLPHVPTKSWKSRPTASTVESRLALAAVARFSFMLK